MLPPLAHEASEPLSGTSYSLQFSQQPLGHVVLYLACYSLGIVRNPRAAGLDSPTSSRTQDGRIISVPIRSGGSLGKCDLLR